MGKLDLDLNSDLQISETSLSESDVWAFLEKVKGVQITEANWQQRTKFSNFQVPKQIISFTRFLLKVWLEVELNYLLFWKLHSSSASLCSYPRPVSPSSVNGSVSFSSYFDPSHFQHPILLRQTNIKEINTNWRTLHMVALLFYLLWTVNYLFLWLLEMWVR